MRTRALAGLGMVAVAVTALAGSTGMQPLRPSVSPAVVSALSVASAVPPATDPAARPALVAAPPAAATPTPDGQPAVSNIEPLPNCAMGDVPTPMAGQDDWPLTLVDTDLMVPSTYVPDDLVGSDAAGFSPYYLIRAVMVPDLQRMGEAAAAAGAPLGIASAYRSYDTQVWTFSYWVNELGYDQAFLTSARAGHSEHQLGLAIDFKARGGSEPWDFVQINGGSKPGTYYTFAKVTAAGAWLAANAWKYGFIMSYPDGGASKSCYGYEPWHYRYFGVEAAALIHASGLSAREWMWRRQPNPEGLSPMATPAFQYTFPAGKTAPTAAAGASGSSPSPPRPTGAWPAP
ncbi:MAG TPA: M15 family metallopeptidase [Candidatus Limnocylindrales bacterium]